MSSWTRFLAVWKTLSDEEKERVPEAIREVFQSTAPDREGTIEEALASMLADTRQRLLDSANSVVDDFARDVEYNFDRRLKLAEREVEELRPEVDRLKALAGEDTGDFDLQVCLENLLAFYRVARDRDDVDAIQWTQHRLNPDWEVKDYFAQDGIATYSGAEIAVMLAERGYRREIVRIDGSKTYKVPRSPGADGGLWRICSWGNAYYYKAMAHYAGVESVGITDRGTIVGVEERIRTAGAQGVVARFLRPYVADPGDVLPREPSNAIIWPEPGDYTEIRF